MTLSTQLPEIMQPSPMRHQFFIDGRYVDEDECRHISLGEPLADRQLQVMRMIEGHTVVDVGCYSGTFVKEASRRHPDKLIVGVDYFMEHIRIARFLFPEIADRFFPASAYNLAFADESVDCVTFQEVIEHLEGAAQALKEINRILRLGGTLVLTTNNPFYWHEIVNFVGSELKNLLRRRTGRAAKLAPVVFFENVEWNRHLYCWSPATLMTLLHANGFEYVEHGYAHEAPSGLGRALARLLPFLGPTQVVKVRKVAAAPERLI